MYCIKCGKEIEEGAAFCPACGASQQPQQPPVQQPVQNWQQPVQQPAEESGIGWGILGFFIPLAGLVLFLVWKDTKPKSSKAAGVGALISVGVSVTLSIISAVAMGIGSAAFLSSLAGFVY